MGHLSHVLHLLSLAADALVIRAGFFRDLPIALVRISDQRRRDQFALLVRPQMPAVRIQRSDEFERIADVALVDDLAGR